MKKNELIDAYLHRRQEWNALLAQLTQQQMLIPLYEGGWTIKDILAHLTWHEREMVGVAQERALIGSPWWELPFEQRNELIYELNKDLTLEEVLSSAETVQADLLQAFESLTDADMLDASRYDKMPADWLPWQVYVSNMQDHYTDHIQDLRNWLKRINPKS
jgi:hypothetical protein